MYLASLQRRLLRQKAAARYDSHPFRETKMPQRVDYNEIVDRSPCPATQSVVIQEWAIGARIPRVADRLAGDLAPFRRTLSRTHERAPDEAGKTMSMKIDAAKDPDGAIRCLTSRSEVNLPTIGIIGFYMGRAHTCDADHAFFREDSPEVSNAMSSADAWPETISFFAGVCR
jgi:dienelactone hydrolase